MAYLGNRPAESFASFEKQVFTIVNSQTAYTLSHSVTNENDIRLVVNSVVQEPGSGKAYTASGTTLTLSAALTNGTDTMYCVFLGRALQTVNPPNASVGSDQTAPTIITGQTAETSIATDDTILIHDTSASALRKMTRANFVSGIGGSNSKTFYAYLSSDQSATNGADTELVFNTEVHDADSVYNNSNGRYTPGVGTYLVSAGLTINDQSGSGDDFYMKFLVNGSSSLSYSQQRSGGGHSNFSNQSGSAVIVLSSASDYISVFGYHDAGTGRNFQSNLCFFTGFKLI